MVSKEDLEAINVDVDAAEASLVEAREDLERLRIAGFDEEAEAQQEQITEIATSIEKMRRAFPREE